MTGFFASRWRGQVPLRRLFWRDAVVVGTLVNLVATLGALVLLKLNTSIGLVAVVHFAPLPYNLFLFGATWRSAGSARWIRVASLAWLVAVTVA